MKPSVILNASNSMYEQFKYKYTGCLEPARNNLSLHDYDCVQYNVNISIHDNAKRFECTTFLHLNKYRDYYFSNLWPIEVYIIDGIVFYRNKCAT